MFETVVIATDGSESARRGVRTALDIAATFDATVHALYVIDTDEIDATPAEIQDDLEAAISETGEEALDVVRAEADDIGASDVVTTVREGNPATEIIEYATDVDADVIGMGTRGRSGDHAVLLGSVAETVVRRAPMPVLTTRQLESED